MKKKDIAKIVTLLVAAGAAQNKGAEAATCATGEACTSVNQVEPNRNCGSSSTVVRNDTNGFTYNSTTKYKYVVTRVDGTEIDLEDPALVLLHRGDRVRIHQENVLAWWGDLRATDANKPNIPNPPTCTSCSTTSCSTTSCSGGGDDDDSGGN